MKFTKDEFRQYMKKNKIASDILVETYIVENDKDEYQYDDVDAIYQMQVTADINKDRVYSQTDRLPHSKRRVSIGNSGNSRTINGVKYGGSYL